MNKFIHISYNESIKLLIPIENIKSLRFDAEAKIIAFELNEAVWTFNDESNCIYEDFDSLEELERRWKELKALMV